MGVTERRPIMRALTTLLVLFALAPVVVLVIFSLNDSPYYAFPLRGLTFHWYADAFHNDGLVSGLTTSLVLALETSLLATALASTFAYGIIRYNLPGRRFFAVLGVLPLFVPTLVLAIGLQILFVRSGVLQLGRTATLAGHVVYASPFAVLIIGSWMSQVDWRVETAARDLGASYWQMLRHVTWPASWIGIRSGLMLTFLVSFNQYELSLFLSRGFVTLPVNIASQQSFGLRPDLLAFASIIVAVILISVLLVAPSMARVAKAGSRATGGSDVS